MEFKEILDGILLRCEGVQAALLMDLDGMPIETSVRNEGLDSESLGVEYARIVSETKKMSSNLESGSMRELDITTDYGVVAMRLLGDSCFLALSMDKGGLHGKGRYLARLAEFDLLEALA